MHAKKIVESILAKKTSNLQENTEKLLIQKVNEQLDTRKKIIAEGYFGQRE